MFCIFSENRKSIITVLIICTNGYKQFQYIPKKFAHANDLINKKRDLIVRDERQRLWDLRLCYFGTGVCMKGGWHEFRYANCLKEGDRVMFEVVANGEKPIWQFHGKFSHFSSLLDRHNNSVNLACILAEVLYDIVLNVSR